MKCPFCGNAETSVVDSRPADDNTAIRRRRYCEVCGRKFTTFERVETIPFFVIKKDDVREKYDRSKIEKGIVLACHKRPVSAEQINNMVNDIEKTLFSREEHEARSSDIGEEVMKRLKEVDSVAYVRFASVYKEFKDVDTFMSELEKLKED